MSARQRRWLVSSKKELHLDSRRLGNLEAREIAEELSVDSDTHDLWLGRNHISDEGVTALAWALERNTSLKKLGLSENQFGDEGVCALADALRKNSSLEKLWLHYNPKITDVGGRALRDALLVNPALVVCDVDSTTITDPALKYDIHELAKMSEERRQAVLTGRMISLPSQVNPNSISSPRTVSFRINPNPTTPPLGHTGRPAAPSFYSERSNSYVPSFLQDSRSRATSAPAPVIINPAPRNPSAIIKPPSPAPPPQRAPSPPLPLSSSASPFVPSSLAPSPTKPAPNPFYTGATPFFFPQPSAAPAHKAPSFASSAHSTAPAPAAAPTGSNLQLITAPQRIAMLESEVEKYKQELETRESQLEVLAAENRALLDENARLRMEHKAQEHEIERLSRENLFLHGENARKESKSNNHHKSP